MKKIIFIVLASVLYSTDAYAVDLVCTVPDTSVTRGSELCNEARIRLRVRAADWNNNVCATYFLRLGLIEAEKISTKRAFTESLNTAVRDAVTTLTTSWPPPTRAECGDGILDAEFGEQCDDGNVIAGDGCNASCQTE